MEKGLNYLLLDELHDLLSAENQIVEALPEMVKAALSTELKSAFQNHLKETKGQVARLKKIFKLLKVAPQVKFCKATKGLIQECKEVLKEFKVKSLLRDAALISKAQRIEHYEMAAYGTVRTFANELNLSEVAKLLDETLDEESAANKKLSSIAEGGVFTSGINHKANLSVKSEEDEDADEDENEEKATGSKKSSSSSKKSSSKKTSGKKAVKKTAPKKTVKKTAVSKKAKASGKSNSKKR
jgi:ferritin-like metal-binding protein YciE